MGPASATASVTSSTDRHEKKNGPAAFQFEFDRFAVQNEEWIVRIQNLRDEESKTVVATDGSDHTTITTTTTTTTTTTNDGHLAAIKTILQTARLANLQCASEAYRHNGKRTAASNTVDRLALQVEDEIDADGNHHESMLRNILCGAPTVDVQSQHPSPTSVLLDDNELCTSADVDAFFDDYPECGRTISDDFDESDSDCSSDSFGSEEEDEAVSRHRNKRTTNEIASRTVDLVQAASEPLETQSEAKTQLKSQLQVQTQVQAQALKDHCRENPSRQEDQHRSMRPLKANNNRANTTAVKNPYANHKPNGSQSTFSVPRGQGNAAVIDLSGNATNTDNSSRNGGAKSFQNSIASQGSNQNHSAPHNNNKTNNTSGDDWNSHNAMHNRQRDPNPYKRPLSSQNRPTMGYEENSNSNDAWMDHRNQTNPFLTAREVALAEQNNPHKDPFRNRSGDGPSRSNYQNARQQQPQNAHNNPYGYEFQGGPSDPPDNNPHDGDARAASSRGPFIPDSLKRKFQRPKRGLGSLTQTSKAAGQRSHLWPSSSSNPNSAKNSYHPTNSNHGSSQRPPAASGGDQIGKRSSSHESKGGQKDEDDELPEELQHLDKELVKKIQNEIMESGDTVTFDDIAGLEDAKATVQEVVCWPMKRPDLFTGLRRAPNGLLLYGPPGTGKTLIGKAIAHESGATFFSISSSSLTSKWIGEGEKLVKTLFAVAAYNEPAVIFLDEIDSLLTQRKSTENEASRRIKTEFLVQLDGTGTSGQGRVLIIGATNRPQELDEAARRRFTKRLYIPLPVKADRKVLLKVLLKTNNHELTEDDIDVLAKDTEGFSGADLKSLCTDAAMGPIRQLGARAMDIQVSDVPPISYKHFKKSLRGTRPSVAPGDLTQYVEWDKTYGTKRYDEEEDDE